LDVVDLGITSEIGCFDINTANRLVLVGFEFKVDVGLKVGCLDTLAVGFNDLSTQY